VIDDTDAKETTDQQQLENLRTPKSNITIDKPQTSELYNGIKMPAAGIQFAPDKDNSQPQTVQLNPNSNG
jgi:hypothetical protein